MDGLEGLDVASLLLKWRVVESLKLFPRSNLEDSSC